MIGLVAGARHGPLHAVFSVSLRADQIVSGTAINFLALGITGYLFMKIYGDARARPTTCPEIPDVHLPIGWIPFVGEALEQLNLLVWVGLIAVAALSVYLFRTPRGLRHALGRREPAGRRHGGHLADPRALLRRRSPRARSRRSAASSSRSASCTRSART